MSEKYTNRRGFLAGSAAAAVSVVPRHVLAGAGDNPPSEKLNIAGIGVGGMGKSNLRNLESENIVALCDVDHEYAAPVFKRYPKAKVYTDFRKMLDKQKDIDAVVIATPDHTHAVISMAAMLRGKHVYCQKPLTHDIYESRMLAKAAKEEGVVTQMGIQGHSAEGGRLMRVDHRRRDRRSQGGRCLVQPVILSVRPCAVVQQMEQTAQGQARRSGYAGLGPLAGTGAESAVSPGVSSRRLALLVGLRLRHDGRSRGAYARSGLSGAEIGASDERGSHFAGFESRHTPGSVDSHV